ncbi:uncharacterized protein LOC105687940 isoform X2 [Athalia rosae]|uniref:uncharacterized protein LOC105687940 isoform X2 n=1 Tax=Athalia rosae TaxID=37344 RepID=UPI0020343C59|nr:uncharacterized protein LOC105687940 isoform X2 [Athalia rosae]
MWRAILVSLLAQGLTADKISYDGSASFVQSSSTSHHQQQHQQQWSWQDPGKDLLAAADTVQGEAFHPVTFEAPDALKQGHQQNDLQNAATAYQSQQYNANVQQDGSGVAQAFDQAIQSGRNLEGYDEVYSDPNVKNALRLGNDTVARAYIRDKLCSLGLMNCDDPEGRRPYYSPHRDIQPQEIIYAQPVTIKPVGRPLPAIPVKRPYGPPRPVPVPPGFGSGPPGPIYSGSSGPFSKPPPFSGPPPSFSGPSYGHPPSFSGPYPGFKKPGPIYDSKPVYEGGSSSFEGELDYEDKYIEKKQVILHQGHDSGVQQHVHHHYHHGEEHNGGGKAPTVVVNNPGLVPGGSGPVIGPGPIGVNGFNNYGYGNGGSYGSGGSYGGSYNDHFDQSFKKEFKIKTPSSGNSLLGAASNSYAERYPSYEKPRPDTAVFGSGNSNKGGSSFSNNYDSGKQFNSGFSNSQYDSVSSSNGFGSNGNRYGSNDFGGNGNGNYASGNGNGFGSVNNYGSSNGFDNGFSSSNNDDCVCVPYEQCPTVDQLGRKDDLYLALDPRNLNKNIEAETVEVVLTDGNGNMSVVRVPKGVNVSEEAEHKKEEDNKSTENGDKADKDKVSDGSTDKVDAKRSKRDVKQVDGDKAKKTDAQGRLVVGDLDTSKLNVKPTWGVSFGLPQGGAGGYPINPYGGDSLVNPYPGYGAGGQGLNLGLVSVNPLVAVQVTKDEYGDKIVKPFVNLHVTPNHGLVHKLGDLLHYKKQVLLGKPGGYYPPHYHPAGAPIYEKPYGGHHHYPSHGGGGFGLGYPGKPHYPHHPPVYKPHYEGPYGQHNYGQGPAGGYYREDNDYDEDDYDYSDYGDGSDYYRSGRANNTRKYVGSNGYNLGNVNDDSSENDWVPSRSENVAKNRDDGRRGRVAFPQRRKRDVNQVENAQERQFGRPQVCGPRHVCCRRPQINNQRPSRNGQCGVRNSQGINGRIKTPVYVDGDSEFGEYPWQVAILKKDPSESVYVCGGTLISPRHILTAAHCIKTHSGRDLRARLGEWDVNHDVEFFPYIERDIVSVVVHPEFYAGTLYNDIAILKLDHDIDFERNPHISPACLPNKHDDFNGVRCWTTGWGKDAFGDFGKYQNILKEVDVPVISNGVCENQMRKTRLGYSFNLHPGFICAGGEEGKDACKGDGGGPMVCERQGRWQLAGVVSWGIGCGQAGVPGVYARVSHYLDWIRQVTGQN